MSSKPIYVESFVDASVQDVWEHTQQPDVHQLWDARFTEINYLPKEEDEPQRFTYSTTVLPGFKVGGLGESIGERHREDGTAYSGLKFWSDHPISLIKTGSGFWRYVPHDDGVRFLTKYDYQVRWGPFGRLIDRFLFRPVFGWGTAWSFDRLRLWIEQGIHPAQSRNLTVINILATVSLALVWFYQGLVPKILFPDAGEAQLFEAATSFDAQPYALTILGVAEMLFGLLILIFWKKRWPFMLNVVAMVPLALGGLLGDGLAFVRPFNPVSLNLSLLVLALISLFANQNLPSGKLPLRKSPEGGSK